MSQEFNSCSNLVDDMEGAHEHYCYVMNEGINPLDVMLDMQASLQTELCRRYPNRCDSLDPNNQGTCGGLLDFLRLQDDFIADETRELYTSLGGMSNGKDASAIWKPWKASHEDRRLTFFSELSEEDRLEVKFEMIDAFHFIMNKFIALGMDAEEIFKLYYLKNAENFKRQENGY
ncbi:MAG: hypothetical protein ACRC9Y_19200 [Aeromonas veronii]